MVITIEGMNTCKILVEIIAETEAEILTEIIVMTEAGQEKEHYLPEGIIIMIAIDKMQTLDSDQGPGVDSRVRQIEIELDVKMPRILLF